jgi:hypothetical protein
MPRLAPLLLALPTLLGVLASPPGALANQGKTPSCIQSRPEARYLGFAWDHFVLVQNTCDQSAVCSVSTSANPDPIAFTVPSSETRAILTFRANPSREFTYDLRCTLSP